MAAPGARPRIPPGLASAPARSMLLELPDPCLLAVLQWLWCGPIGATQDILCAGLAHSRLHQLSVLALPNISMRVTPAGVDSLLLYLGRYGQHINSINLLADAPDGHAVVLKQLPDNLVQLHSLILNGFHLQLQPGRLRRRSFGVLRAPVGMPLQQLRLFNCTLLDGPAGLTAALSQLEGLKEFKVLSPRSSDGSVLCFPTEALPQLQQLTNLALHGVIMRARGGELQTALQPLHSLTRLVELSIGAADGLYHENNLTASMLAGASQLTRLEVVSQCCDADVLAGKTQLRELTLALCMISPNANRTEATAQLLSQLQHLQQLTRLTLASSCQWFDFDPGTPPTARAYSALTASTQLEYLDFANNTLPPGAWKHMFPDGRQLPKLRELHINSVRGTDTGAWLDIAHLTCLDGCCPNLEVLEGEPLR